MKVLGMEFTSAPTRRKPITLAVCAFDEETLRVLEHSADGLDAVLCAVQAAWAYGRRDERFGIPSGCDLLEGWIVDPVLG